MTTVPKQLLQCILIDVIGQHKWWPAFNNVFTIPTIDLLVIFKPSTVWLLSCIRSFCWFVNLPVLLLTADFHLSKYAKKSDSSQRKRSSSIFLKGARFKFLVFLPSNKCLTFTMSNHLFIISTNSVVLLTDSPYKHRRPLATVWLNTWAARLTRIFENEVKFMCFLVSFGQILNSDNSQCCS